MGELSLLDMAEYARAYSAEVEYSDENTDVIFSSFILNNILCDFFILTNFNKCSIIN